MIIFVNIFLDQQIVSHKTFTALLMAIASTMLTTPMATPKLGRLLRGSH